MWSFPGEALAPRWRRGEQQQTTLVLSAPLARPGNPLLFFELFTFHQPVCPLVSYPAAVLYVVRSVFSSVPEDGDGSGVETSCKQSVQKSLSVCRFCAALSTQIVSSCLMFSRLVCLFVSSSVSVQGQRFSSVR